MSATQTDVQQSPGAKSNLFVRYVAVPFIVAVSASFADALTLLLVVGTVPRETFVLVIFLEGGLGLISGVVISLSSTPTISAVGERLFGTSPWSRQAERRAERVGWRWMIASAILIFVGFLVSTM
ncbi:MAG TPA: hypothetical protein VFV92_16520 [Candidatus Bathyarchaeia archaeon]|nr:hypothetical protein [Candidatus Bathyarchaeia archaeon]